MRGGPPDIGRGRRRWRSRRSLLWTRFVSLLTSAFPAFVTPITSAFPPIVGLATAKPAAEWHGIRLPEGVGAALGPGLHGAFGPPGWTGSRTPGGRDDSSLQCREAGDPWGAGEDSGRGWAVGGATGAGDADGLGAGHRGAVFRPAEPGGGGGWGTQGGEPDRGAGVLDGHPGWRGAQATVPTGPFEVV